MFGTKVFFADPPNVKSLGARMEGNLCKYNNYLAHVIPVLQRQLIVTGSDHFTF